MTSSLSSQGYLKGGPLYSFINEITTLFMITEKRAKISSLNFLCIDIMRLWLHLYKYIFMTSLMTSHGHKVGQIFKSIYLRQYLMLMAIFLVYSIYGITPGKKVCCELKMAAILKILKYSTQLQFHLIYGKIVPSYAKKRILWWWRHRWRHRVASKFPSIFMFRRGWLNEQVARAMSR